MTSIGAKIDALFALRKKKRAHEESIKELEKNMGTLQAELITQLQAEGITSSRGKKASISISENVVPQVEDWEAFYKYIGRKKYFHLQNSRHNWLNYRKYK